LQTQQSLLKRQQLAALQTAVKQHLAQPVRALLMGAVRAEELETARHDLARLSQAALRVAHEE
jgi:hypothetical protein